MHCCICFNPPANGRVDLGELLAYKTHLHSVNETNLEKCPKIKYFVASFSRSIDQEINDVIEEITEAYLFSWLRNLIGNSENESDNDIKYNNKIVEFQFI